METFQGKQLKSTRLQAQEFRKMNPEGKDNSQIEESGLLSFLDLA